jgi:drug/metabolite transporter (DMT)-like permease
LLGAVTVGLYYLVGRSLRQRLSLWPYVGLVYGACLLALLVFALVDGTTLTGFAPREWMLFGGIALGPMLLGHTGFNWSLRYVPAYVVSLAVLAEPVGAAVLAYLIPAIHETPSVAVLLGGGVVLVGLGVGSMVDSSHAATSAPRKRPRDLPNA